MFDKDFCLLFLKKAKTFNSITITCLYYSFEDNIVIYNIRNVYNDMH